MKKRIRTAVLASALVSTGMAASAALADGGMTRIATVPFGAEVAGIAVNGVGEVFFNAQHPAGKSTFKDGAPPALIGYVDGLNLYTYKGPGIPVPDKDKRNQVHAVGQYVVLGKAGDKFGDGQVMGGVYDTKGKLMFVSNDADYNAFIPLNGKEAYKKALHSFKAPKSLQINAVKSSKASSTPGRIFA